MKRKTILEFRFWICDLKSKIENLKSKITDSSEQASPKASPACNAMHSIAGRHCGGQAMIEFTIALVAVMAIIVGMILLNELEQKHTSTMTKARGTAGSLAMDLAYHSPLGAQFISDWQAGADNIGYTHDDEPIPDGTAIALVGDFAANADLDTIVAPPNAISRLQSFPDISSFCLVGGSESESVSLGAIPGAGRLFSGEPVISVESKAWLAWTGGIY